MPGVHPVTGEYYYNTILGYGWSFLTNDISVYDLGSGTPPRWLPTTGIIRISGRDILHCRILEDTGRDRDSRSSSLIFS